MKKDVSLEKKYEIIVKERGEVIEHSVIIEDKIKDFLLKTGGDIFVVNEEKKKLDFYTGSKDENEIGGIKYKSLISAFIFNIEKVFEKVSEEEKENIKDHMTRFFSLRAIFAHVSIKYHSQYAEFSNKKIYDRYFGINKKWRNIHIAKTEFYFIFKWIEGLLEVYQRRIFLGEELMKGMIGIPVDDKERGVIK